MLLFGHPDVDKLKANKDVKGLIKALRYPKDRHVREAAVEALGQLGDARAVEGLIAALNDDDRDVREAAVEALGQLGDARAVDGLTGALDDEAWRIRDVAVEALGQLGDTRAVDGLIGALDDRDSDVRGAAATALGNLGDTRAVQALIAALADHKGFVRSAAAAALDGLAWSPDRGAAGAAYWIAKQAWKKCVMIAAIEPLLAAARDDDRAIRDAATTTLVKIGARAVDPLVCALDDDDSHVRGAAATALGNLGDARAVDPLIGVLDDDDSDVRGAAAAALGRLGDTRAVDALIAALTDDKGFVRRAAAGALDGLGWSPDTGVAGAAYCVINRQLDQCVHIAAVEPLVVALRDRDEISSVREAAATVLGQIGDTRAVDPLLTVLHDEDVDVGRAAAKALVALYSSGMLDEGQKAKVLAQRDFMTYQDHVPEHEGVDAYEDRSIGVDFPL